jgi:hypothetical protein
MTFGIKYSMVSNMVTTGEFDKTGLCHIGRLTGDKEMNWRGVPLAPGSYNFYTNGSNEIFLFPEG